MKKLPDGRLVNIEISKPRILYGGGLEYVFTLFFNFQKFEYRYVSDSNLFLSEWDKIFDVAKNLLKNEIVEKCNRYGIETLLETKEGK